MNLFELTDEYRSFVGKLQDLDLPTETVLDTIESMQGEMKDKIRAVIFVALEKKALAKARKETAKKMMESAELENDRSESLLIYAQIAIQNSGLVLPIKYPEFNVNLQKNPASCEVFDIAKLDDSFKNTTVTYKINGDGTAFVTEFEKLAKTLALKVGPTTIEVAPDKRSILESLKAGERIEGARLNPDSFRMTVK